MNAIILKIKGLLNQIDERKVDNPIIAEKYSDILEDLKKLEKDDFKFPHKFEWLQSKLYHENQINTRNILISSLNSGEQHEIEKTHYLATYNDLLQFVNELEYSLQ